jgi:hypothetical protein
MVQTLEENIDGIQFLVQEFPGLQALTMKARVATMVGPALAKALEVVNPAMLKDGTKVTSAAVREFAPAFEILIARMEPEKFTQLCLDLLKGTTAIKDGVKHELSKGEVAFNAVFTGQIETLYKVLVLVFKANRFFGLAGIGNLVGSFATKMMAQPAGSDRPKAG